MINTLAHYRILDRIGVGGTGEVYRGRDTRLGRTVAVKILAGELVDDPERRARLLHYARAASALSHPNIAALYEVGEDQGRAFLVGEFVPGDTLAAVMGGRPINPHRAVALGAQLADALAEGHAAGIVHGAIHPGHVIVTPKGNPKILDFGVTMSSGADARSAAYLSPEQMRGEAIDHRTDIFSLGVLLAEMATGTLPSTGKSATASSNPPRRAEHAPVGDGMAGHTALPRELDAIIDKMTAEQPELRYESAAALAAELRELASTLAARSTREPLRAPVAASRRRGPPINWLVLILVAGCAAAAWFFSDEVQSGWRMLSQSR
jgi:serine/threonine-protein kinase